MRRALNLISDPRVALPLLVLCLALLTGPRVFSAPLWGDEFRTWRDGIEKPLSAVLTWTHNPDHAPLGHLLARAGAALFGVQHAWALRLGSWLCGLACVPAIWWMGRTLWSNWAGLLMAAMFVVDPNLAYQMTQARMYAPLALAGLLCLALAGSVLTRPERPWRRVLLLAIAISVGIWSHAQIYAMVLALVVTSVGLLLSKRRRAAAFPLLVGLLLGLALGAQGVWKIAHRHDAETVTTADVTDAPGGQLEDALQKLTGKRGLTYFVAAAAFAGFAMAWQRPAHRPLVILLLLVIALAILNLIVAARYRPVAHARYLTILQPCLWFGVAVLVVELWRSHRRTLGVAAMAAVIGVGAFEVSRLQEALEEHPLARPFAAAARTIRSQMRPGDRFAVAARSPYGMYTRYYGLTLDSALDEALSPTRSPRETRRRIEEARLGEGTVWLLCVVPPPNIKYARPTDDPRWIVAAIGQARSLPADSMDDLSRGPSWKAVVLRIDTTLSRPVPGAAR